MAPIVAIKPGLSGEMKLEDDSADNEFIHWIAKRAGTYIPSALAYGDGLYVLDDKGIVAKLDIKTGEKIFKQRLSRQKTANITSSP
ncbi:MAG: serine/threonine protein kinase, partial [Planctomycetaceae bacterium]